MKPDPATGMFLTMAEKDYVTIRKMAIDPEFADEVFGFHVQQATGRQPRQSFQPKVSPLSEFTISNLFSMRSRNGAGLMFPVFSG